MTYTYDYPHPAVTTDIAIFTIRDGALCVLLVRRGLAPHKGAWALPGGFVKIDEDIEDCAKRELAEETGVANLYLEQLRTFGKPDRDPRERVITVAYYALVPTDRCELEAGSDADAVEWFAVDGLPKLAFDHGDIIAVACRRLAAKLTYSTIAFQLLPNDFTLGDVQSLYETILGEPQDKRNFRKWILALDRIEETGAKRGAGAHRPAKLYRVKDRGEVSIIR